MNSYFNSTAAEAGLHRVKAHSQPRRLRSSTNMIKLSDVIPIPLIPSRNQYKR